MARKIDPLIYVEPAGRNIYRPSCPKAQHFAAIAGTETLSLETIAHIKDLGFRVEVRNPAPLFA